VIDRPGADLASRLFSRRLMVGGLTFWGASASAAFAPRVLHAALYPNGSSGAHMDLIAAQPVGAATLWAALAAWCISWALVTGHLGATWAAEMGRPSWATPALLLLSFASPLVFGTLFSVLVRLATGDVYHGDGGVPFIGALALQLVISQIYSMTTRSAPRAEPAWAPRRSP
jgi:hypothetical protein